MIHSDKCHNRDSRGFQRGVLKTRVRHPRKASWKKQHGHWFTNLGFIIWKKKKDVLVSGHLGLRQSDMTEWLNNNKSTFQLVIYFGGERVVVQLLTCVWLFATPWTTAHQASLSFSTSCNLLKLMSIELVMPSNHCLLSQPLLLFLSIFPSIRIFSNEAALHIR